MRLTVYGIGGRGDVQPLIALATGLRAAGHEVRFVSHRDFEPQVRAHGLLFQPIGGQSAAFFGGPAGRALRDRLRSEPAQYRRFFDSYLSPFMAQMLSECLEAGRNSDALVSWPWMRVVPAIAEALGIPVIVASAVPNLYLRTSAFANPFHGEFAGGSGEDNLRSWESAKEAFGAGQEALNQFRKRLGMPLRQLEEEYRYFQRLPHLLGFSRHILPKPNDWAEHLHVTGAWRLDTGEDYAPPRGLKDFLDDGPPPVVIGFSSSVGDDPREMTSVVIDAVRRSGKRAIFVSGFGGLKGEELPANILAVETAPYSWLLPRVAAIVHHAGAGSTSDGLRAGLPSLGIPFGWDQSLWARRIFELGVGCEPIPARELSAERLSAAIVRLVEDRTMREGAVRLGALLRAEDGVARAVEIVEMTLGTALGTALGTTRTADASGAPCAPAPGTV